MSGVPEPDEETSGELVTTRTPDGDPAQRARLEEIARSALARHDVDPAATLTLLNISENATYAVDDPATGVRSVLRVHRPGYHSRAAIESELAWIGALRADDVVRTPQVLPARDGAPVATGRHPDGEERHAVRFEWCPGAEPAGERLVDDFRDLGAVTARLHLHARSWARPASFTRFRWDYETSIGPRGHWGRWQDGMAVGAAEHEVLGRLDLALRDRLAAFGDGPDRFGLVHADMRLANLLVDPQDVSSGVTVIDFDDCGLGWFMYDLGSSLSFIEHDPRVPELIDAWAGGYRTVAPLSAAEEAELPTFVLLRRLLLVAWIGSHSDTDLAQEMGEEYTAVSCDLAEAYLSRPPVVRTVL
ncbi:MAG: phosphotransferase [Actinobacteria bacterium]|nr:phosphotransferase [Actinomycetota bacterium]